MKTYLSIALLLALSVASCKKDCEKENFGYLSFKNTSTQNLKIRVNNTIPQGCLSQNNGNLAPGATCEAEITANIDHSVVVLTDSNTVYWEFDISVGPCGDRGIHIQ